MTTKIERRWRGFAGAVASAALALAANSAHSQTALDADLIRQLREGGYVIVMRHASAPRAAPDAATARPANANRERQLDDVGLATAAAMGEALRALKIPIGEVLVSPTFRALETAERLSLGEPRPVAELGDGGRDMRADTEGVRSAWLRSHAATSPPAGSNKLMITHVPNLVGAFGETMANTGDGEALIVDPRGGEPDIVARVPIEDWPKLATGER